MMTKMLRVIALALLALLPQQVNAATTILPAAETCFADANGALSGGSVYMYVPSTTTFKQSWQDSSQSVLNPQPIPLDSNGCALIYGVGSYRQQVYTGPDNTSTLLWDQVTTDTSAYNSVFWAGLAGGTPNVITIVDPGFNATDGTVINFIALSTNTAAATINPSGFGAITVLKDTTGGPTALTGGEIVASNSISVVYRSSDNAFHLLNPPIQSASGSASPLCGATGLVITNGASPSTIVSLTAAQIVTQNTAGLTINRSSVSLTAINTGVGNVTSTANGMDGEAVGTSQWIYVWAIDNGSAAAGLLSTSSTAPTMPSGYTYKCRMGAVRVDGAGNLLRTLQNGSEGQYKIVAASNVLVLPTISNGVQGTYSLTNPTLVTASIASVVPATATRIVVVATSQWKNGTASNVLVAANTAWGGANNGPNGSGGQSYPIWIDVAAFNVGQAQQATIILEASTIAVAMDAAGGFVGAMGWKDAVNAN